MHFRVMGEEFDVGRFVGDSYDGFRVLEIIIEDGAVEGLDYIVNQNGKLSMT